ncbi:MAG: universal stress protein, partial [Myxococcales bacterium]|nr:universal stress protein [Myxococcales bacterium]
MSSDTIIASVDLGPTTPEVILAAVAESGPGGTVLVTHCLPDLQAIRPLFPERGADDLTRSMGIEDAVRRHLEELIKSLQLERVEVVLGMGQPYAAVTQLASDRSARLIVVGSPSDPSAWFAGTALRIARYAECPVLLHRTAPSGPI